MDFEHNVTPVYGILMSRIIKCYSLHIVIFNIKRYFVIT